MLLDGTFAMACLKMKINIKEQMPKYIGQEVKILTTKCAIAEVEKLGPELFGATKILKQFGIHKCGHEEEPQPALKCLRSMANEENSQRYFIVTQDAYLRGKVRKIPGTPVIYLHHKALTLEKPSETSNLSVDNTTQEKVGINEYQAKMIAQLKTKAGILEENTKKRRRKKKGGPNPLSCLKKKKSTSTNDPLKNVKEKLESACKKKKRRRNKKTDDTNAA
jgi:U3 small nucleolar RNA-associated protein 23